MSVVQLPDINLTSICKALTAGEFFYYYQPIISLESGKICGAEALIRWKQADGSVLMPANFIPLAESTGFITEMNQELLPGLLEDLNGIIAVAPSSYMHFNLSDSDLKAGGLAELLYKNMVQKGVATGALRVEIVESVFMPPIPHVKETITQLETRGIPVILNDFSAGYTTLNFLSDLPLTAIKLAMNIVQQAITSKKDFRILRHLVSMGHQLDLEIIAEGIETEEMYDLVLSTGATSAQGYYFSYPLPLDGYLGLLQKDSPWSSYPFGVDYLAQIDLLDFRRDVIRAALAIRKYESVEACQRALSRLPVLDFQNSTLGEWYSSFGREWETSAGFGQLRNAHREIHETASRLIEAALNDEPLEHVVQLIKSFSEQSSVVAQALHEIELQGLIKHYQP